MKTFETYQETECIEAYKRLSKPTTTQKAYPLSFNETLNIWFAKQAIAKRYRELTGNSIYSCNALM